MSNFKFVLNWGGVGNLLKGDAIAQICMQYAQRMQQSAGEGYEAEERRYPERTGAAVFPATLSAFIPVSLRKRANSGIIMI